MDDHTTPTDAPPPEDSDTKAPREPSRISPAGVAAVQGLTVPSTDTRPDQETVRQVAPREEVDEDAPSLSSSAANDLELAAQRAQASKSTHWHAETDDSDGKRAEYYRLRSEISEEIAVQNITKGVHADAFSRGGTNFPNYDVLSPQEVSSVKVHSLDDGQPRFADYREEFEQAVNPDSKGNRQAAERLLEIKAQEPDTWTQLSPHLPRAVRNADSQPEVQAGLAERATLRIPQDQVTAVRADLRSYMAERPAQYGLDPRLELRDRAAQIERMVQTQVLSIDDRYATAHYQAKAADLAGLRDLALDRRIEEAG